MVKRKFAKKAYMHTIEAAIAIVMSMIFLLTVASNQNAAEKQRPDLELFSILKENPEFRDCVISENYSCLNSSINTNYPDFAKAYTYRINITNDPNIVPLDMPQKDVRLEALFIAGNNTYTQPKVARVYYWIK